MSIPLATYRLQLSKDLPFQNLGPLFPFLKQLGISDIYTSPIFQAQPCSSHGYDVTNFAAFNDDLGGYPAFITMCHTLQDHGLGLCIDIVPNHMAATECNYYWQDVLVQGKQSPFAFLFDIDWSASSTTQLVYRRFFDINELICLRTDDLAVFKKTHRLLFSLIEGKLIQGLRIDHVDGLRQPETYLKHLKKYIGQEFYIIVEKILGFNEVLPPTWSIAGTTGYDFINRLNQVYVEPQGLEKMTTLYQSLIHSQKSITQIRQESIQLVVEKLFNTEFKRLVTFLKELISEEDDEVANILLQICTHMPVYRIYANQHNYPQDDKNLINSMIEDVQTNLPRVLEKIKQVLLLEFPADYSEGQKQQWTNWLSNWQVLTGPLMAKGFEDTSCYRYNVLLSLNEVGSSPEYHTRAGELSDFHAYNQFKQQHMPYSFNATSTHDTKRSEDVRARLNVLSELSDEWSDALTAWLGHNQTKKSTVNQVIAPDINDEIMLYQTLLGIWPLGLADAATDHTFKTRMANFLIKALRESKQFTSWFAPCKDYEQAMIHFFESLLTDQWFMDRFLILQKKIAFYGLYNSLTQVVLKTMAPGVPDFYQGSEGLLLNLVDPDNRRAVDYDYIMGLTSNEPLASLLQNGDADPIKFNITQRLLAIRHRFKEVFLQGNYIPLEVQGPLARHVVAFARTFNNTVIIIVSARWFTQLIEPFSHWSNAVFNSENKIMLPDMPSHQWRSLLTEDKIDNQDNSILMQDVLVQLPFNVIG